MKTCSKEMALKCLDALYNSTNQSQVDKTMYNALKTYVENSETSDLKKRKEYQDLEREWFYENQLRNIYKRKLDKILAILKDK